MLAAASINWFEMPAANLDRAARFYETILGIKLIRESMGDTEMAVFPHQAPQPTGCLIAADGYRPDAQSTTVYLNLTDDLDPPLARVWKAGGKVLQGKTALPGNMGFYAKFEDSEGNRVGFYSPR